jgi:hypothetical protein
MKKKGSNDKLMRVLVSSTDYNALEALARQDGTTVSEIVRRQIKVTLSRSLKAVG